ncbi:MAG: aspartate-semialdehyde dehydrogenase [Chloroflexi bacterium]|nr:aspartate-semialdehyde dehydrogenase [Chloroflexota bacterium]
MTIRVAVIGATGVVGQQFLVALAHHPWFKVERLAASSRSAGKRYAEALRDPQSGASRWLVEAPLPEGYADITVEDAATFDPRGLGLVFTGIEEGEAARQLEPRLAQAVPVVSTASAFRMEPDVPLVVPYLNADHLALVGKQREHHGWKGFIVPIPNCTTTGLVISLAPIVRTFGVQTALMVSLQALSGAGRSPGVSALDILDNVVPYIPREEEKVARETAKILGKLRGGVIEPLPLPLSAICTRVNVRDGHTEAVFVSAAEAVTPEAARQAMTGFQGDCADLGLPSAPEQPIAVRDDPYRPQPRLDRDTGRGMTTVVGRIEAHDALPNGLKWVLVSHNTRMGAAQGAVLTAELLAHQGYLQ